MKSVITTKTKLRAFLDERGVRYSWVADQLGISRPHFHFVMDGERPMTNEMANRLAELFGVSADIFRQEDRDE